MAYSHGYHVLTICQAARMGNISVMSQMIANGYGTNEVDECGTSPLLCALGTGISAAIELLLANGADVNAKDDCSFTPLHNAVVLTAPHQHQQDSLRLLLAYGADVTATDESENTPLQYAISHDGCAETIKILSDNGANVNRSNVHGCTPLHFAEELGSPLLIDALKAEGAIK